MKAKLFLFLLIFYVLPATLHHFLDEIIKTTQTQKKYTLKKKHFT
jgi:hypothetical protein